MYTYVAHINIDSLDGSNGSHVNKAFEHRYELQRTSMLQYPKQLFLFPRVQKFNKLFYREENSLVLIHYRLVGKKLN